MITDTTETINAPLSVAAIQARLVWLTKMQAALRREKDILAHARLMLRVGYPVEEVQAKITRELARITAHG